MESRKGLQSGTGPWEAAIERSAHKTQAWVQDRGGATAIEYALLAALIAVACVAAFAAFGTALIQVFAGWIVPALAAL